MPLPRILRTVTFKLALTQALLFGVCAAVLFGVVYSTVVAYARRQLEAAITTELSALIGEDDPVGLDELIATVEARSKDRGQEGRYYLMRSADGRRLAGTLSDMSPMPEWREVPVAGHDVVPPDDETHAILVQARPLPTGGALFVGRDTRDVANLEEVLEQTFAWAASAALGLAIVGGIVTSRRFLRRIETVNATTLRIIAAGDMAARIPVRGTQDEIDRLAINLNTMLGRIQDLIEGVRQVSSDIAHDLRTPLTHLRQRLELARANASSSSDYEAVVEATIADADTILKTFAALLRIAQIEAGTRRSGFSKIDLTDICGTIVEIYGPVAEDNGQRLTGTILADVRAWGDRELVTQMLANLAENAIRHAGSGTSISLALNSTDHGPEIVVADNGPGIPAGAHEKVFQRFYRGDASRSSAGSGLGLSLVRAVADLHDVTVRLHDNHPGLRAVLQFRSSWLGGQKPASPAAERPAPVGRPLLR